MLKKTLFYIILFGVLYLCMEVTAFAGYWVIKGTPFTFEKIKAQRAAVAGDEVIKANDPSFRVEDGIGTRVVHPYVGFVLDPAGAIRNITVDPIGILPPGQCTINAHGFAGEPTFLKKQDGVVNIVIVGGSVSNQFYCTARDHLIEALKRSDQYKNKEIHMAGLGIGAHHQPQQLMAVNYYLAHGGEFDILINIDGFNEVFVPTVMVQNKMYPSYPLFWNQFISSFNNKEIKLIGVITFYQDMKRWLAEKLSFAHFSVTANVAWSMLDDIINVRIQRARIALNESSDKDALKSFHWSGPKENIENLTDFSVNMWFNSSLQLARISKANGAAYFHFLQPNIHFRNSKPLSEKEHGIVDHLPIFIPPDTTDLISNTYPLLSKKGGELSSAGAHFYDLTYLFKDESGTVYIDAGGHLTPLGNDIMAKFMGQKIIDAGN